jgi:hypothetical protein
MAQRGTWENWTKDNGMSRIKHQQFTNNIDRDHVKQSEISISRSGVH